VHVFSPALWGFGIAVSSPTDFCQVCVMKQRGQRFRNDLRVPAATGSFFMISTPRKKAVISQTTDETIHFNV
jgi:hypothetical protein